MEDYFLSKIYKNIDIYSEIEKKINTLNKTRNNRIEMSLRLIKYSEKWKLVFFFLNIEAVIFIILSLTGKEIHKIFDLAIFSSIAGIFSIYVILLQYYVNELNFNQRALKTHYHQLDIEDLILRLKELLMKKNSKNNKIGESNVLYNFSIIMNEYQTLLKNNENHDPLDYQRSINNIKVIKGNENEKEKAETEVKTDEKIKIRDLTIANILWYLNFIIMIIPILTLVILVIYL